MNHLKVYKDMMDRSLKRGSITEYSENHHVLPKCMGGDDSLENLRILTGREHFIAHALLCYIHPSNSSLLYAFNLMKCSSGTSNRPEYIKGYQYQTLKEEMSESLSKRNRERVWSVEDRMKMSLLVKKRKLSPMKGKKHTKEARMKMGIAASRKFTEDHKNKLSEALTGRKFTEEHRRNLSDKQLGDKNHFKGKKHTEENKFKIIMSRSVNVIIKILDSGVEVSEETYKKNKSSNGMRFSTLMLKSKCTTILELKTYCLGYHGRTC